MKRKDTHYYLKPDELSPHDVKVLGVIRLWLQEHNLAPAYRDIKTYTQTSTSTIVRSIRRLELLGYVTRKPRDHRILQWTGKV